MKKSRLFRQFQNHGHLFHNTLIVVFFMRSHAGRAVFDAVFEVCKLTAAFVSQSIQGAVAEQTVEGLGIGTFVAGKIFAGLVLEKSVVTHKNLLKYIPGIGFRRFPEKLHPLPGTGMFKSEFAGPKCNITWIIQFGILFVSHQR